MLRSDSRICDICGSEIPKGETYRKAAISPEAARVLLDTADIDMVPTLTQEMNGMVNLDICLECHMSMGTIPSTTEAH
ncbi:MAG: hypothetical protein AB1553_09720 [Nitrospirota bacterium]